MKQSTADSPVLFDMDGVILQGKGTAPAVYAEAGEMALEALDVDPAVEQRSVFRDLVGDESLVAACNDVGIDAEAFWSNKEQYASQLSHERITQGPRGIHGDTEVLQAMTGDWTLGLVSNNRHETVEFVTDYFGLDSVFAVLRGRDPTIAGFNRRKPKPYYLMSALEAMDSESGIYVGDREKDYEAATKAGMQFVHLDRPSFETHDELPAAAATIHSLTELPEVLPDVLPD